MKLLSTSAVLVALFAACTVAHDHHDVSRAGKNISFVLQVSSSGASTPQNHFFKAKNASDEPKILDFLTPLG
jgi:hypothetical protein